MSARAGWVIYGRRECGLCEEMADAVLALSGGRVDPARVDVDDDPELARRYGADVPVLCLDDEVVCRHFVDPDRLGRALDADT